MAKSKPTMNLAVSVSTTSSTENSPFASKSKHPVEQVGQVQGNLTQEIASVEFSRMAKRCISGRKYMETCRDRRRPGTPEQSLSGECWPHNLHISTNYVLHM